jgi:hypothetical protein
MVHEISDRAVLAEARIHFRASPCGFFGVKIRS